jgi:hypothetical protein
VEDPLGVVDCCVAAGGREGDRREIRVGGKGERKK